MGFLDGNSARPSSGDDRAGDRVRTGAFQLGKVAPKYPFWAVQLLKVLPLLKQISWKTRTCTVRTIGGGGLVGHETRRDNVLKGDSRTVERINEPELKRRPVSEAPFRRV